MNIMSFDPYLSKQVQKVLFSKTITKSYHSQICFKNILGIYLNDICYHILVRNVQINARNRCHQKAISKLPQHILMKIFVKN